MAGRFPEGFGVPGSIANPAAGDAAAAAKTDAGTMTYFAGLRSRGEPLQLIVALSGGKVEMKADLVSSEKWAELKPTYGTMPFITKPDGSWQGETEDLMKLLGEMGGLTVDEKQAKLAHTANSYPIQESAHTKAATEMGMDGCGLPILVHGDLKINQSFAVQRYLINIGPNYPKVTPAQKGVDDMFEGALEDMMGLAAGVVLSGGDPANVPIYMAKTLTHLSKYIKAEGFVNGHEAPSKADLVILVLTQALIPFGATLGDGAAECYGKFPEAVALGERAAAFPAVAAWLTNDKCNLKKPPVAARG